MNPVVIAVLVLLVLLVLVVGYYVWRSRRGCKPSADCTPPNTCQNGKCAPPPTPEVYLYDMGRYGPNLAAAQQAAAALGATIATSDQVSAAQAAGAEWCWAGWDAAAGGNQAVYPMQSTQAGCGSDPGVQVFSATRPQPTPSALTSTGRSPPRGVPRLRQRRHRLRAPVLEHEAVAVRALTRKMRLPFRSRPTRAGRRTRCSSSPSRSRRRRGAGTPHRG